MPTVLLEEDHVLRMVAVILDPATPLAHRQAVAAFFAHDEPDFLGWCERLRERIAGLYPARILWARNAADLAEKIADADAVVVESLRVDRAVLARARRLKVVHKFGLLAANIDHAACAERNIAVERLRRRVNIAVAEQAFALLMALAKRICALNGLVERSALEAAGHRIRPRADSQPESHVGYSNFAGITGLRTLAGSTLGIVGLGEIGREIASRARAFDMQTIYFQRSRLAAHDEEALGVCYAPLDALMAQSDHIVVQLPLNGGTRGIIDRARLARLKPGATIVNCARAELIDRDALVEALVSGRLAGLGLDVGYDEPARPDDPLLRFDRGNVILMPHTAVASRANAQSDLERLCVNLWRRLVPSAA
jgi:lactate dehydrogenase-like 2-hydroxyacid dehydrogenase